MNRNSAKSFKPWVSFGQLAKQGVTKVVDHSPIQPEWLMQVQDGLLGIKRLGQTTQVLGVTALKEIIKRSQGEPTPTPKLLRELCEKMGATYIKLGQFIASTPSIFPSEYVREFESCLDQTPALSFDCIQTEIERELGKPLDEVFASVEKTPLGSASIAQVHGAVLKNGERVVIKVQKPHARNTLLTDLNFLRFAAHCLEWLVPKAKHASVVEILHEMQEMMLGECDFIKEANHLKKFKTFLQEQSIKEACCPAVVESLSTPRILVMERLDGLPLTQVDALSQQGVSASSSVKTTLKVWLKSLFLCDFFHGDLHAGNVLVLKDARVGFIDFGVVGHIDKHLWQAVFSLFEATHKKDYHTIAEAMLAIGMTHEQVDAPLLARDLKALFESVDETSDAEEGINTLLMHMINVGKRHGLKFPRAFALLMKQFLYFDRYLDVLDMDINILDSDFFEQHVNQTKSIIEGQVIEH